MWAIRLPGASSNQPFLKIKFKSHTTLVLNSFDVELISTCADKIWQDDGAQKTAVFVGDVPERTPQWSVDSVGMSGEQVNK